MTNGEAVNWLINISADIGKAEHHDLWHYEQALSEIREMLESAQPEPQWIPCSERLPEVDESVLVTTEWNDISIAWRTGIDEWLIHEGNTNVTTDDLTAWMPLPEPWKGEDNG